MKIKRNSIIVLTVGILITILGFLIPILCVNSALDNGQISIIGGADAPTYWLLASREFNGFPRALVLVGISLIISSALCLLSAGIVQKNSTMKAVDQVPEGYREIYSLDLQKDKKLSLLVNGLSIGIAALLTIPMNFVIPFLSMFSFEGGVTAYWIRIASLFVLMALYIVLHEAIHGVAMKICGTKKVKYGFTGLYAFAGSEDYYDRKSYIFIALAPVVLWGIVIAVINLLVPVEWFWVIYLIQIVNLSGAAGDLFVTVKFSRLPNDILIRDHGVGMKVFSKE